MVSSSSSLFPAQERTLLDGLRIRHDDDGLLEAAREEKLIDALVELGGENLVIVVQLARRREMFEETLGVAVEPASGGESRDVGEGEWNKEEVKDPVGEVSEEGRQEEGEHGEREWREWRFEDRRCRSEASGGPGSPGSAIRSFGAVSIEEAHDFLLCISKRREQDVEGEREEVGNRRDAPRVETGAAAIRG